jgi:uncharacterized protein (DUF58 family)
VRADAQGRGLIVRASPLLASLSVLALAALVLGLLFGRAELLFAAIPPVVALLSARRPGRAAAIEITADVSATRLVEGDEIDIVLTVTSADAAPSLEIFVALPPTFAFVDGKLHLATSLGAGGSHEWKLRVRSTRRGRCELGPFHVRLSDDAGLAMDEALVGAALTIETYPRIPRVRRLPRPARMRSTFGNYVARQRGSGLEPAEIRAFVSGDSARRINWPVSLRLGRLYTTDFHQERNADVVILLDTLAETGAPPHSSLDASVQAVAALASAYIARKDRVGLVEFGGYLRWVKPATGRRQLDTLLQAAAPVTQLFTPMARTLDYVPAAALPRQALIVAVSPVVDERFTRVVADLVGRGYDLMLLAVSPIELTRRAMPDTQLSDVACELWRLERDERLGQLRRSGIVVTEWRPDEPLDGALAALAERVPARANA